MSDRFSLNPDAPIPEGRREAYELMARHVKDLVVQTNQLMHDFVGKLEAARRSGTMTDSEVYECLVTGCAEITHELKHCFIELEQLVGRSLQKDAIGYLMDLECGLYSAGPKKTNDESVDPAVEVLINSLIKLGR